MPIKSRIDVEATPERIKESLAQLAKYQTALKALYGSDVLKAPYIRAASAAGDDLSKFIDNLDRAAGAESRFSAAAQKAGSAFHGLASGVKQTLENLARYALSPLQLLFPAGLVVGLAGIGAGLVGAGTVYGLERGAAAVSDRRRRAMGLGVSYGSLSAYDLDFSRFGVGEGTLGAVAGGVYDVTSPQYLGLLSSGARGRGDTSEAAVDLIRRIPELLKGVPDEMVGPVARSRNLTSILDLPTIIRLRQHPEEIEEQIKRYQQDRKTLDIGKDAQEKWASFNAALDRAGRDIETVLGKNLVALTPGLTKFSDGAVRLIDAFINSRAVTNALQGIHSGLQWFEASIGSSQFRHDSRAFLEGLDKLGTVAAPALLALAQIEGVLGLAGLGGLSRALKKVTINGATFWVIGEFAEGILTGKIFEPTTGANRRLAQTLGLEPKGDTSYAAPREATNRLSLRYFAGHGAERPPYPSGVIDLATGKMEAGPRRITIIPSQNMSKLPDLSGKSTYSRKGEPLQDVSGFIWHHTGSHGTPEDIIRVLNQRGLGVQYIMDREGHIFHTLPEGTRGAHILPSEINDLSNANTEGMEVIANDDSDVTAAQVAAAQKFAVEFSKLHPGIQYFGHGEVNPHHKQATEGLTIANAVRNGRAPTIAPSGKIDIPLTQRTLMNFAGGTADAAPAVIDPLQLPGATPAQSVGEFLGADNKFGLRNLALRRRGRALHILDHIDKGPPTGPIIVHDMTGGSVNVSISRHEATQ